MQMNDFSGMAEFTGATGAVILGLIAWSFLGLVEKTETTSMMIDWFFDGRS